MLSDSVAVVYRVNEPEEEFIEAACSRARKTPFVISVCNEEACVAAPCKPDHCVQANHFSDLTLAGPLLVYNEWTPHGNKYEEYKGPFKWWIRVRDLRTGRLVRSAPTSTSPPGTGEVGNGLSQGIVAKPDGSIAWIAEDGWHETGVPPDTYQVWKIDKTGQHLLAMSPGISPYSIALAGNTVYWTNNGIPELAPLN